MSIQTEREDQAADMQEIAALFNSRPLSVVTVAELQAITPNYHQRVSECRRKLKMDIRNVPVYIALDNGRTKRLAGNYKFHPIAGAREGTTPSPERWAVPDAPYEETWRLKP